MTDFFKKFGGNPNPSPAPKNNPQIGKIKDAFNLLKGAKNPQFLFDRMMQNNPMYQNAMNYIQQNGGNAQKAFYNYASQCGASEKDINDVINMLH